jgi:hypothetical protein
MTTSLGGDVDYPVTHHGVENLCFGALNGMSATWSALIILFTHRISLAVMNRQYARKNLTVKNAANNNSAIPDWANEQIKNAWNIEGRQQKEGAS